MRSKSLQIACILFALAFTALSGCETTESDGMSNGASAQPAMGMVNDTCPISGMAVSEGAPTRTYKGNQVGFCCSNCPARWDQWSDEKKAEYISSAKDM